MTNSERITSHNARLAAMKETVAALPEAGGGGSVETCTVTITGSSFYEYLYTAFENGELVAKGRVNPDGSTTTPVVFENVLCGTAIYIHSAANIPGFTLDGGCVKSDVTYGSYVVIMAPTIGGANGSVNIRDLL